MADLLEAITIKRYGGSLSPAQVEATVRAAADGSAPDYQLAALLMAIVWRGLDRDELAAWTRAMLASGESLDLAGLDRPRVDKHSTGGVGDKASIPLGPAVAACGAAVPMISGRGLGHTGGTLDKLEAIPGFSTDVALADFRPLLERTGLVFAGQTPELVPADKRLYALRDVTGTVEAIPLISSSILSKKLAEDLDGLVLDVKFGSGAFMPGIEQGEQLARTMVELAGSLGLRAVAIHTNMSRPLGRAIGHSLEIEESLDCLRGAGPADLRELVSALGGEMLAMVGLADDVTAGCARIERSLDDGSALAALRATVEAQGGDPAIVDGARTLEAAPREEVLCADRPGKVAFGDLRELGRAVVDLGGGRKQLGDAIDSAVGLVLEVEEGQQVEVGAPLVRIRHRAGKGLERALERLRSAVVLQDEVERGPLCRARFAAEATR
jgi:pyrimidine-nucleoside phosphorylase